MTPHALIAPAVDAERFASIERPPAVLAGSATRPLRVLAVARLAWSKGHEFLLEAVARARDAGTRVELRVAGDGKHLEAVAFAVHQLGLDDCVRLLGAVRPDRLRDEFAWADVFMHLSVAEGFCNAVLEAQAAALPVVCSDADGLAENVVHGETGFVVSRRDTVAAAVRLTQLAREPELRERMGAAGRRRALTRFRPRDQIEAFERLYREACGG